MAFGIEMKIDCARFNPFGIRFGLSIEKKKGHILIYQTSSAFDSALRRSNEFSLQNYFLESRVIRTVDMKTADKLIFLHGSRNSISHPDGRFDFAGRLLQSPLQTRRERGIRTFIA